MNFPNNPTVGDIFDSGGVSFVWNGAVWALVSSEAAGGGVPRGGIILWSGAANAIPAGWALCDGAGGTPDLRGRFIVGAGGVYNPGDIGGAETVTLAEANMPAHTHGVNITTDQAAAHQHSIPATFNAKIYHNQGDSTRLTSIGVIGETPPTITTTGAAGAHTHAVSGNTGSKGGGAAHENRPPYFALAYIMRL